MTIKTIATIPPRMMTIGITTEVEDMAEDEAMPVAVEEEMTTAIGMIIIQAKTKKQVPHLKQKNTF